MDTLLTSVLALAVLVLLAGLIYVKGELELQRNREAEAIAAAVADATPHLRKSAIKDSRRVRLGLAWEQWLPFFSTFPVAPEMCRFIGSPVDFIAFSGLDSEDEPVHVILVEIKTGNARLSNRQKRIRDAVQAGRIKWMEVRVPQPE